MEDSGQLLAAPAFSGGVRGSVPWDPPAPLSPPSPQKAFSKPHVVAVEDRAALARNLALGQLEQEEAELWRQLRRKGEFEARLLDKYALLAEARGRRTAVAKEHADVVAAIGHLSEQLEHARQREREVQHDIAILSESNRILQASFQEGADSMTKAPAKGKPSEDWFARERGLREQAKLKQEQIVHVRAHLERLSQEKGSLRLRQQDLFARQRGAEQDRNRLLGALQDDRGSINKVRAERIRLWDERARLDQEAATLVREIRAQRGVGPRDGEPHLMAAAVPMISGAVAATTVSRWVRGATPALPTGPAPVVVEPPQPLWAEEPPRPQHWTTFGEAAESAQPSVQAGPSAWTTFGGGAGAGDAPRPDVDLTPDPFSSASVLDGGTAAAGRLGGGLLGGSGRGSAAAPLDREETARERVARRVRESAHAEVLRLDQADRERQAADASAAAPGGSVTEWAGRLRDFRKPGAEPSF
ncbi:unnamed protein product [Prorocentrum cordatum]|uniref:Cilia- and flagella-associated protein 157 n=1 Tax=Prorocentrum cordatum TaxID=2364126 RepID=A0ABN9Y0J1_9DINO|nr:unnamed protein product [Polarella glacialis]